MKNALLRVLALMTVVNAHWPICYDYAVKDGCYKRDPNTGAEMPELGLSSSNCYYSEPWTGPKAFTDNAADRLLQQLTRIMHNLEAEDSSHPWVPQGVRDREGTSNTGGHESDLALTLPLCPNDIRRSWREETEAVDRECDYKTFQGVQRCGNCWAQICQFHNKMHWNDARRACTQQLFIYRMECYSEWYDRYCGGASTGLEASESERFLAPDKEGVYERCSSPASALASAKGRRVYAGLLITSVAYFYSSEAMRQ